MIILYSKCIQHLPNTHVAAPGYGLYSTQDFEVCDFLIYYIGRVFPTNGEYFATKFLITYTFIAVPAGSRYAQWTNRYVIDSEFVGNEARMINSNIQRQFI